ncbi:MAG TPA: YceI family protein [Telluria sp.]|nr:YceI family protein [Telluria sp.]
MKKKILAAALSAVLSTGAVAADVYMIDPGHTYPSIEVDHKGISVLRGKFNKTEGTITLDRAARTGTMDITIDAASVDFGHDRLNAHIKTADMLDVEKFPTAVYKGKSMTFNGDVPATVDGELTLHGVTRPLKLTINKFKCIMNTQMKREVCGADASAEFNRTDFGISFGVPTHAPTVRLQIEVEAIKQQ